MNIETRHLGKIEIDKEKTINFPAGLPGFNDETKFVLLNFPESDTFQTLQSVENKELAFIVTNPYHFYQDYEFSLDDSIREALDIKDVKDVSVLAIVTLQDTLYTSTMNLKAPLIINHNSKKGKQYILNDDDYSMKQVLILQETLQAKGD